MPIRSGQGVDAAVGQAQAQSAEEGGRHVVGVAGAAGDLLAVEGHGQKLVGSEGSAGQGGDAEGGRGGGGGARADSAAGQDGLVDGQLNPPLHAERVEDAAGGHAAHVVLHFHREVGPDDVLDFDAGGVRALQVEAFQRAFQGQTEAIEAHREVGDGGRGGNGDVVPRAHAALFSAFSGWRRCGSGRRRRPWRSRRHRHRRPG